MDAMKRLNVSSRLPLVFVTLLLLLSYSPVAVAQTGPVDPTRAVGESRNSPESAFDNVNLFNGHVDMRIPLLTVIGRGDAKYSVVAPLQTKQWDVFTNVITSPNGTNQYNNFAFLAEQALPNGDPYGPGLLEVVTGFDGAALCNWTAVARVVLTTPSGAEVEFRDDLTDGRPEQQFVCMGQWNPLNRGRNFHSSDGSAMTFISDADIIDNVVTPLGGTFPEGARAYATGTVITRDGTRYRYELGILKKIVDRNGNTLVFEYESPIYRSVTRITDSLGRVVDFTYGDRTATEWTDEITYTSQDGTPLTIEVNYKQLSQTLRADQTFQTPTQLFPNINPNGPPSQSTNPFNPKMLSSVVFPGNKEIQIGYNSYAEVGRLTLPQGGYIEFEYGGLNAVSCGCTVPDDTGVIWSTFAATSKIQRRVKERRTYSSSTQLESTTKYQDVGMFVPARVEHFDRSGNLISSEKHHFFTSPLAGNTRLGPAAYVWWKANKEFRTEWFDAGGQVVRTVQHNWQQRAPVSWYPISFITEEPSNDPRIVDTTTTLHENNQVSKTTFLYDQFNNVTEEQVFDYGTGAAGALLRKTQTEYLTVNPVNNVDYTTPNLHIVGLPKTVRTYGPGISAAQARTDFEYDNYTDDTNNKPLLSRSSIVGLDSVGSTRGNLTKTEYALNVETGAGPKKFFRYDVAGNLVSEKDARGNVMEYLFADSFSDGVSRNTFAFVTQVRSPIPDPQGQTGSNTALTKSYVYNFHAGYMVRSTDSNNQTTITDYDFLGRPTRILRPTGGGETNFEYSDVPGNVYVKELVKQDATRTVESRVYFDGLGRTVRSFLLTGESPNPWIVRDIHYDELGRVSANNDAYTVATPGPTPQACGQCTVTTYDAVGRVASVVTPDGSSLQYNYSGNSTTIRDQAGNAKTIVKDALGRTKQVVENPGGLGHSTTYTYDALSNMRKVVQDAQQRFYLYDALSRVVRVRNVEESVNTSFPALTDPFTNNNQWTRAYTYDDNGNLTEETDARGVVTTIAYDPLNRSIGISFSNDPSGTLPVTRSFDLGVKGKGKLYQRKTTGAGGTLTTFDTYDNVGNVSTLKQQFDVAGSWSQAYIINYAYNLTSGTTSITYPSNRSVSYHYDDALRTDSVTGTIGDGTNRNYATGITYTSFGQMKQEMFGTNTPVYNKRVYNSRQQLAEILASTTANDSSYNRGKILNQYSLQCSGASCNATDNNGNIRKQEVFVPQNEQASSYTSWYQQYDYDALNRLKRVHEFTGNTSLDWQQEYQYDRWSNRTIDQANTWGPNIPEANFGVIPSNNRLSAPAGFTMTYDPSGNILSDTYSGVTDRVYDARQRMTAARGPNSQLQTYVYDADGRRVRRNVNGVEVWQIYGADGELLAEYAANGPLGSPQTEYAYRNGELLIATENSSSSATPPSSLVATPPTAQANLTLNWAAAAGAVKYRVERKAAGGAFTSLGTTTSTTMTDNSAVSGAAYLYKVCAADAAGNCTSNYSNIALGTAFTFTDPTIVSIVDDPTGATVTSMKAVHITQLRTATNAVRSLAGLPNASWTFSSISVGQLIHVEDVREIRTALGSALTALGVQPLTYTDPNIKGFIEDPVNATTIKAAHIRELRLACTTGIGGSGGPGGTTIFSIHWLLTDHLGTPRMSFDLSGSVAGTRRFDYLPFGEELNASQGLRGVASGYAVSAADRVRQKFTAKERDSETNLDYFGARYYSATLGRFTGPDTFSGSADNPQTLNLYLYVNNNPLRAVDPNGHWTFDVTAGFAVTALLHQEPQKPAQQPTEPAKISDILKPSGLIGEVKVTALEIYDEAKEAAIGDANKWIGSQLLFPWGPRWPQTTPDWLRRLGPSFVGLTGGYQAGFVFGGQGSAYSGNYTIGMFKQSKEIAEFWTEGGFTNPTKYCAGFMLTAGVGAGLSLSNAENKNEMLGTSQTVSVATPTTWGGDFSWSWNSKGQFVYNLNITVGKSFGAGIVTYPTKTTEIRVLRPAPPQ